MGRTPEKLISLAATPKETFFLVASESEASMADSWESWGKQRDAVGSNSWNSRPNSNCLIEELEDDKVAAAAAAAPAPAPAPATAANAPKVT